MFAGKTVLVTGGTGSIGREVVRQVLPQHPRTVRVFSRGEEKQFLMQQELADCENIRYLIGDVRDEKRVSYAMKGADIVIHAAAMKHVPASEFNPMEAVKTNVYGTQNVIEAAINNDVERFTLISTDKVVNPANTMGATKLLAEKLVLSANQYRGTARTIFAAVRFGNVMGSSGSVIPVFVNQIKQGQDVTLTDPRMTRFMMSIPQAAGLVLQACERSQHRETFVLRMPAVKMSDLANWLIDDFRDHGGVYRGKVQITGARQGEKVYEELMTPDEAERALADERMYLIPPPGRTLSDYAEKYYPAGVTAYSSEGVPLLDKSTFLATVHELGLLEW